MEQSIFASMIILPFSLITSILHLQWKWKKNGELKLLNYLNPSVQPYLKPIALIMMWIMTIWFFQREFLWPKLVQPIEKQKFTPIKVNGNSIVLIYEPQHDFNQGSLLVIQHKRSFRYPLVFMLENQWQIPKIPHVNRPMHSQALKTLNQLIPNSNKLKSLMGEQSHISLKELFYSSNEIEIKIWIQRILIPVFTWIFLLSMWVRSIHRPQKIMIELGLGSLGTLIMILLAYQ
jgi:hypothetical protein